MSPSDIADCVLETFDRLPAKRKPIQRDDKLREWIPLSGIVLSKDGEPLKCASLGTGMKCLPSSKLPQAHGNVLHDWHAEVVAIRAFNRFLIQECSDLAVAGLRSSKFIRRRRNDEITQAEYQPFAIKEDVRIHMYCSEAPCGDASMELIMAAQEDATPWPEPQLAIPAPADLDTGSLGAEDPIQSGLRGRAHFSLLGHVRLKPSRADAPPTSSKSCTDKLSLCQTTSLLSSLTSLLLTPRTAYLYSLVLPSSQHVAVATHRAFSANGRMAKLLESDLRSKWQNQGTGYIFKQFKIETVEREFSFSRRSVAEGNKPSPSNLSAVYTPHLEETLIGGVLQGRKQFDPRGASSICRRSMWKAVVDVASVLAIPVLIEATRGKRYRDVKECDLLAGRRMVEADVKGGNGVLKGWTKNGGDNSFQLTEAS